MPPPEEIEDQNQAKEKALKEAKEAQSKLLEKIAKEDANKAKVAKEKAEQEEKNYGNKHRDAKAKR